MTAKSHCLPASRTAATRSFAALRMTGLDLSGPFWCLRHCQVHLNHALHLILALLMLRQPSLIYSRRILEHPNKSCNKKRLQQLVKGTSALDMRAMSTASKHLQAALVGAFCFLCVSDGNHRIGISPDDQHRD